MIRPRLFQEIITLENSGQLIPALDIIFDTIDDMLIAQQFDEVDIILDTAHRLDLSHDLILGFLVITLPAKDKLKNRVKLFTRMGSVSKETLCGL